MAARASAAQHPLRVLLERLPDDARSHALRHSAWVDAPGESFERLEFLGDSVLGVVMSAELFRRFPELPEGQLSKIKAAAVSRSACALVALEAGLGEAMAAAAPDAADPQLVASLARAERVLAALTESVIGAAYVEIGFEETAAAVLASFEGRIGHAVDNRTDAKSDLQEFAQRRGAAVEYEVVSTEGPDHDRTFTVRARIAEGGLEHATGSGRSKKAAEQAAARKLLGLVDDAEDGSQDG